MEYISIWLITILCNTTQGLGRRSKNIALGGDTWRGSKWVTANILSLGEKLVLLFFFLKLKFNNSGTNAESAYNMTAMNQRQGHCCTRRSQHTAE